MKAKYVFSYVYKALQENGYFDGFEQNYERMAMKANKVSYFAELIHQILFGEKLITDVRFSALPYGPAIDRKHIEYENINTYANTLTDEEKEEINVCLKKWICDFENEDLIKITHGDFPDIKLIAWQTVTQNCKYGTEISDDLLKKDVEIFKEATRHRYV